MVPKKVIVKLAKQFLIAYALVLVIDFIWLLLLMKGFYQRELSAFARPEAIPYWSAFAAWALIAVGIIAFVTPKARSPKEGLFYGALFGLVTYGIYDFTNYAIFAEYTLKMLVVDIVWGMVICGIVSFALKHIKLYR